VASVVAQAKAVVQTLRQASPTEVIGPATWWLAAIVLAAVIGIAMWYAGELFIFQLVAVALIFVVGGGIIVARGEPVFILMSFLFVIVGAGGLMVTANLVPIANTLKIGNVEISLLFVTWTVAYWAGFLDRILNGLTRPFFGWVSDHIGRENTMFIAFF